MISSFDYITVTQVPEPSATVVFVLGLLAVRVRMQGR